MSDASVPVVYRWTVAALAMGAWLSLSGCMTTLGYVPSMPKPSEQSNYTPAYKEIKKWAYDVADGYDSRATMNRYAIYGGAILAAGAAAAVTAIAAYDGGSSALIGIPIGAAFLGGLMAMYSNEDKARIYGLASAYAKDLIVLSDERLAKRKRDSANPEGAVAEMGQRVRVSAKALAELSKHEEARQQLAAEARQKANAETDPTKKLAATELAAVAEALRDKAVQAKTVAKAQHDQELRLQAFAISRQAAKKERPAVRQGLEGTANMPNEGHAEVIAKPRDTEHDQEEAFCLERDINTLMRRVEEHIALLDPKNVSAKFKEVKTQATAADQLAASVETPEKTSKPEDKLPVDPQDLTDLKLPVKTYCTI